MKTVLITGASSGLGFEFANIFAKEKYNLVLVARNEEKLKDVAKKLEKQYGIIVTIIPADLSDLDSAKKIYDKVIEKQIVIDCLVNNAGSGHHGLLANTDPDIAKNTINLNVTSLTLLTNYFIKIWLKGMKERF